MSGISHFFGGVEFRMCPSHPDLAASSCGLIARITPTRLRPAPWILLSHPGSSGYLGVSYHKNHRHVNCMVHKLVCEAWNGPCSVRGMQCCHNNGVKTDNCSVNLRWATGSENMSDKVRHGTWRHAACGTNSKLSWESVFLIRAAYSGAEGEFPAISRDYAIGIPTAQKLTLYQRWNCVNKNGELIPIRCLGDHRHVLSDLRFSDLLKESVLVRKRWSIEIESRRGEKLSWNEVYAIRSRYTGVRGEVAGLAKEFGVGESCIRFIVQYKTWSRFTGPDGKMRMIRCLDDHRRLVEVIRSDT